MITYLATPYSHHQIEVRYKRFQIVTHVAGLLSHEGVIVFSPITHGHPMAEIVGLPTTYKYWQAHCEAFIAASGQLIVLKQDGWQASIGVRAEIAFAYQHGVPIVYMDVPEPVLAWWGDVI